MRQTFGRIFERLMLRDTLYANAIVDLVKQGHYSDISVAIFALMHPSNTRNRTITICCTGVTKQHSLGRL